MLKYANAFCYSFFLDSSDEDETSSFVRKKCLPVCVTKSLPALPERHSKKSPQVGSESLIESRTDSNVAAPSASHAGGDENGDPNLAQASTSYGPLNTVYYPRTPLLTSRKLESKKHSLGDSDSSSDENLYSSVSYPISGREFHEQTWTFEEGAFLLSRQDSCTGTGVSEAGSRGKKRRHSSSDCCSVPDEPSSSAHSFVTPELAGSVKVRNFVSVSSNSCSITDKSSDQEEGDLLCQKLKTVSGSSSTNVEVNCCQENDVSKASDSECERSSEADRTLYAPFHMNTRCKFNRVSRCNKYAGPHLFRHPHLEASDDSTISDLCIMSFAFKGNETDGTGYVRIVSPQLASARPELHTLVVKNYKMITDASLTFLLKLKSLRYLDVSGTSVTELGVLQFKLKRPDVEVISDYKGLPD
jgi:hypothetical protein